MSHIQFPNQLFGTGEFSAKILDNNGDPSTVLEAGAPFKIQTAWRIPPLAALLLGGLWKVTAYVESIGPGPEQEIASDTVALNGGRDFSVVLTVPANTLPNDPPGPASGVYKVVTVLTHRNFGKISNVAALVEGPVVRIA